MRLYVLALVVCGLVAIPARAQVSSTNGEYARSRNSGRKLAIRAGSSRTCAELVDAGAVTRLPSWFTGALVEGPVYGFHFEPVLAIHER